MQQGRGGMGTHKHGVSGRPTKSPKLRHALKREAEADERKDSTRIKNPAASFQELLGRPATPLKTGGKAARRRKGK